MLNENNWTTVNARGDDRRDADWIHTVMNEHGVSLSDRSDEAGN
jgi:hypothetical protein